MSKTSKPERASEASAATPTARRSPQDRWVERLARRLSELGSGAIGKASIPARRQTTDETTDGSLAVAPPIELTERG